MRAAFVNKVAFVLSVCFVFIDKWQLVGIQNYLSL